MRGALRAEGIEAEERFFLKKKKITVYNGHSANCLKGFALVCNEREACNRAVTEYKKRKICRRTGNNYIKFLS